MPGPLCWYRLHILNRAPAHPQSPESRLLLTGETGIFSTPCSIAVRRDCRIHLNFLGVCRKLVRSGGKLDFVADDRYRKLGHFRERNLGPVGLLVFPCQRVFTWNSRRVWPLDLPE